MFLLCIMCFVDSKKLRLNQKVLKIQSASVLITYRMLAGGQAEKLRDLAKQTRNSKTEKN